MKVIVCAGLANGHATHFDGLWLKAYDPDTQDGRAAIGDIAEWTGNPNEAMRFPDAGALHALWTRVSTVTPKRPDGRPNRPLTAFSVLVTNAPEHCAECEETGMHPTHLGSKLCESGSLRSGGRNAHCSCDVCF